MNPEPVTPELGTGRRVTLRDRLTTAREGLDSRRGKWRSRGPGAWRGRGGGGAGAWPGRGLALGRGIAPHVRYVLRCRRRRLLPGRWGAGLLTSTHSPVSP